MKFEWDEKKAAHNLQKHGVSFDEAQSVFEDPLFVDYYDSDHSSDELRYLVVGESRQARLLIVSYTEHDEATRLISAREVTPKERKAYEEF